ncbi:hypothetical protein ACFLUP_02235 [Chloroflexota bacterium]
MTLADIHGKLEGLRLTDRSEDLLTANIFGSLRYIPPSKVLIPFLKKAQSMTGTPLQLPWSIRIVYYSFWPSLRSTGYAGCEPDVVLGLETEDNELHIIMVEVKYRSGPSSLENEGILPHHQLARELDQLEVVSCDILGWETSIEPSSRKLIYLTQDFASPREDIDKASKEYLSKRKVKGEIYWLSWRLLPSILENSSLDEHVPEHRIVMDDMLHLLEKKRLTLFSGVIPIISWFSIPDFYQEVMNSYDWPDMDLTKYLYSYNLKPNTYKWPNIYASQGFSYHSSSTTYNWSVTPTSYQDYQYREEYNNGEH